MKAVNYRFYYKSRGYRGGRGLVFAYVLKGSGGNVGGEHGSNQLGVGDNPVQAPFQRPDVLLYLQGNKLQDVRRNVYLFSPGLSRFTCLVLAVTPVRLGPINLA